MSVEVTCVKLPDCSLNTVQTIYRKSFRFYLLKESAKKHINPLVLFTNWEVHEHSCIINVEPTPVYTTTTTTTHHHPSLSFHSLANRTNCISLYFVSNFLFLWLHSDAVCDMKPNRPQMRFQTFTGKNSVPLQALSGPEGSRELMFPDFMTTAHGGGKVFIHTHRPHLPPGNSPGTHFC